MLRRLAAATAAGAAAVATLSPPRVGPPAAARVPPAPQSAKHILGLPVGQHITLIATAPDGTEVSRPYTPTSSDTDVGHVDFVIKVYRPCEKFPTGGQLSQLIDAIPLGGKARAHARYARRRGGRPRARFVAATSRRRRRRRPAPGARQLGFEGPKGRFTYRGRGVFAVKQIPSAGGGFKLRTARKIGLIAGGTGITPMLQVISAILRDPRDTTEARSPGLRPCALLRKRAQRSAGRPPERMQPPRAHPPASSVALPPSPSRGADVAAVREPDGGGHPLPHGDRGHGRSEPAAQGAPLGLSLFKPSA